MLGGSFSNPGPGLGHTHSDNQTGPHCNPSSCPPGTVRATCLDSNGLRGVHLPSSLLTVCHQEQTVGITEGWRRLCSGMRKEWLQWQQSGMGQVRQEGTGMGDRKGRQAAGPGCEGGGSFIAHTF